MNTIEISITCFDDAMHACKAVITVFNRNPSHPRTLNDWPGKWKEGQIKTKQEEHRTDSSVFLGVT
jgi:hypothetical protein